MVGNTKIYYHKESVGSQVKSRMKLMSTLRYNHPTPLGQSTEYSINRVLSTEYRVQSTESFRQSCHMWDSPMWTVKQVRVRVITSHFTLRGGHGGLRGSTVV